MARQFSIDVLLDYQFDEATDVLLQIEAAALPDQRVMSATLRLPDGTTHTHVTALDGVGERLWLRQHGRLRVEYRAQVAVERVMPDLSGLAATPHRLLPGAVIPYLMPSRYCPSDRFHSFVERTFGEVDTGAGVVAMGDWVRDHLDYVPGSSHSGTCANDTFVSRQGICRDFAHLLITFARAAGIPARFASVYASGINPPDFHAVAQVYLGDAWHMVDATGMASADAMAIIGVGRDATDVAFLTAFGTARYNALKVSVSED